MLLSSGDIEQLEKAGYRREVFALFDVEGYAKLRNVESHCVFYDVESSRCKVYASRPLGCRLYPIIYVENKGIVADKICRARGKFDEKTLERRGRKVLRLLEKIDEEAESRRNWQ
jgi:Fe-S-cluster containining protein